MVKIELSNFQLVALSRNTKKALRFTIGFSMKFDNGEVGEMAWTGNLAYFRFDQRLVWSPPLSRYRMNHNQQNHYINPYLYNQITDRLLEEKEILKHIVTPVDQILAKSRRLEDIDCSLPTLLEAGDRGNEKSPTET